MLKPMFQRFMNGWMLSDTALLAVLPSRWCMHCALSFRSTLPRWIGPSICRVLLNNHNPGRAHRMKQNSYVRVQEAQEAAPAHAAPRHRLRPDHNLRGALPTR